MNEMIESFVKYAAEAGLTEQEIRDFVLAQFGQEKQAADVADTFYTNFFNAIGAPKTDEAVVYADNFIKAAMDFGLQQNDAIDLAARYMSGSMQKSAGMADKAKSLWNTVKGYANTAGTEASKPMGWLGDLIAKGGGGRAPAATGQDAGELLGGAWRNWMTPTGEHIARNSGKYTAGLGGAAGLGGLGYALSGGEDPSTMDAIKAMIAQNPTLLAALGGAGLGAGAGYAMSDSDDSGGETAAKMVGGGLAGGLGGAGLAQALA